eukprot:scaffold224_cov276-Chaetoceros_neogracile.AAC.12
MANKRKDGSEERLIFSANAQAASNDTSLDENGQESAISVVSKNKKSHSHNISLRRLPKIMLLTIMSGSWITDKMKDLKGERIQIEKEGHGWGGKKKKRCIFQRLPSAAILLAALVVAVLGLSSFASAVPILAKELDTPGAAAMATSTAGDIIPVKQAASDYSQPLLKQVGDMLDSSKASLRALTTAGETTESSQEMDIAVVELDVIAKSPRYKNDGGVDEFQEMSAIMTLLKNHLSDPDFISSLPEQMRNSMQMLQQEMTNAERAMGQIESIIGSSQIDSSSSRRSTMDRSANANSVKREYEESITSQRRVLNEGGTTDQYEQDANQEDSTFHQGEGSSSSFPFQHQTDARRPRKVGRVIKRSRTRTPRSRTHELAGRSVP